MGRFKNYLSFYFWLHLVFVAACWIYLQLVGASSCGGFSCYRTRALGVQASVVAHGLSCLLHVESSQSRDRTRVPWIGRRIPIHCTTREVQLYIAWWYTSGTQTPKSVTLINTMLVLYRLTPILYQLIFFFNVFNFFFKILLSNIDTENWINHIYLCSIY